MSKQLILLIVTLLLITAPFILSEFIRCLPPYNFLQEEKCVSECGIDYVVMQGTKKCILRSECVNKSYVSEFGEQYFPYCIQDPPQNREYFILSENKCPNNFPIKNYITGTCINKYTFDYYQQREIGVFNQDEKAIFSKTLIQEILSKSMITTQEQFINLFDQHCELIDSFNQKCISKNQCFEKKFNISSGDCVQTCQNDLISHEYTCKRKEDIDPKLLYHNSDNNTWVLKHTCFHFKQNDQCHEECPGIKWIDFSTGIRYCDYQQGDDLYTSNKVNLLEVIPEECPTQTSKGCFEFCTKDNYLISEINAGNYHLNNQFLNECEDKHKIQFGIFHIAPDDCPYYISNKQCVKECEKGFKWIQKKNFKQCIPCNRKVTGDCSDHCNINEVYIKESSFACFIDYDVYSFQYESQEQKGNCLFPKILSEDESYCVDECSQNQIPSQKAGKDEFECVQNNDQEIPNIHQNLYLSSNKRRYVVKCNDINEIECDKVCIERSENVSQEQICDWKINEELEFIEREKERLLQKFWSPKFMEENIKWSFKRFKIEVLTIEERIFLLTQMTQFAIEFFQNYAEYADYKNKQFRLNNDNSSILIKMAVLPQKGGLFKTEINFNNSMKTSTIEIETVKTVLIQTLSLTHYNSEYAICTSKESCSLAKFIIIQRIMQEESIEIEPEFQIEFQFDQVDREETEDGKNYICFDVQNGEDISKSLRTNAQLNFLGKTFRSITCKGKRFIGYYYGTLDDAISLKPKEQYELREGQKELLRGQKKLQDEINKLDQDRKSFENEKKQKEDKINNERNNLNSEKNNYELLKKVLTSDQQSLAAGKEQLANDLRELGKQQVLRDAQRQLKSDQDQLANGQKKLAEDQEKLADDKKKLAHDQDDFLKKQNNLNLPIQSPPKIVKSDPDESANQIGETKTNEDKPNNLQKQKDDFKNDKAKLEQDKQQLRTERAQFEKEKIQIKVSNQQQVENKSGSNLTKIFLIVAVSVLGGIIIFYIIYKFVFKRSPKQPI